MSALADILDPLSAATPPAAASAPSENGQASLLDPEGNPVTGPASTVPAMLDMGYQQDTPEARNAFAVKAKYGSGIGNMAAAAGEGALRGATFGLSDHLFDPESANALKELNPISAGAGELAGVAGSALLAPELSPVGLLGKVGANAAEALGGSAAARMAGSAIEGGFYGLGQSASEQALGDPDLTAQKVVANVGLGALLGGAGSGIFQGIAGLGGKAVSAAAAPELAEGALAKGNNYLLGTPEADTAHYLLNPDAVNAAPTYEAMKGVLDDTVAATKSQWEASGQNLDNAMQAVRAVQPDNALVGDLHGAMEAQKAALGANSEAIDKLLDASQVQTPVSDILAAINKQRNAVEAGGGAAGTNSYLDTLEKRVQGLPMAVSSLDAALSGAPQTTSLSNLRDVVQQLRDDARGAYQIGAGEFASAKAGAARSIAETLNQKIKVIPGVSEILADSHARLNALESLEPYFGNENTALSSFKSAAGTNAKNELRMNALKEFDTAAGTDFAQRVKPFQDVQQVQQMMKQGASASAAVGNITDAGPELQALAGADSAHAANTQAWNAVKRLSPGRSQSVLESYASKTAKMEGNVAPKFSLEDTAALNHIQNTSQPSADLGGQTLWEAMRNRGVLDRFANSRANGSRNAAIFGTLGAGIGTVLGHPAGGAMMGTQLGGIVDKQGGMLSKKILDAIAEARRTNPGVTQQLGGLVQRLSPAVLSGMKASTIAVILDHAQKMSSQDPRQEQRAKSLGQLERHSNTTAGRMEDGVQKFFDGGTVEGRPQYAGDVQDTMNDVKSLANNPQELMDRVHAQTASLVDMAPKVASGINDTAIRAVNYLATKIPPPTQSYALDNPPVMPKSQERKFQVALNTVNDPLSVLQHAKAGTLTGDHLDAVKAVYPQLHDDLVSHVLGVLPNQENIPFAKKAMLSKLTGGPLVKEMASQQIAANQAVMAASAAPAPGMVKPGQKGLSNLSVSNRTMTDMQQTASRRQS